MKNLGAYLHFPFCKKKCHYCDFYSITNLSNIDTFVENLVKEIEMRASSEDFSGMADGASSYLIDTIFIGGGTPSLLSPSQVDSILNTLHKHYKISETAEITMECNPGASDAKFLEEYKQSGVNRLSIGVQSFNPIELEFLQRIHSGDDAIATIQKAKNIFGNVSIDLIFAIPNQTQASLMKTLETAASLDLNHISCYSLIFEENTPLFRDLKIGKVKEKDDDESADMYLEMCRFITDAGFTQYEISNFAKPGYRSRHNLKYWHCEDVVSFGTSAVGFINGRRYKNVPNIIKYDNLIKAGKLPESDSESPSRKDMLTETIFLGLRSDGINFDKIKNKFDTDLLILVENEILQFVENDFAVFEDGILKLTSKGYYMCDELTLKILSKIEDISL